MQCLRMHKTFMMNPIQDANVAEKSRILRTSITEGAMLRNVEDNLTQEK